MRHRNFEAILWIGLGLALLIAVWIGYEDQREWDQYSAAHHCHLVGTKYGDRASTNQNQTIYRCDDGKIWIR